MVTNPSHSTHRFERVGLIIVLFVAAYLRLSSPGIVEYKADEANLSRLALDLAHGRSFPLLGITSSVGLPNAPVNVYILAIPYLLRDDPLLATQFVALLNVVAVGLTYWLVCRYCGVGAALGAALIFAASPWSIIFSRKIWAQNMLPVFVMMTASTGILGFIEKKRWAQFAHLPLLILTGQIHYGAFVIVPLTLYLLWHGRRNLSRAFVFGLAFAVILITPYTIGIFRAVWQDGDVLEHSTLNNETSHLTITGDAVHGAALMIAGTEIHSLAGPEEYRNYLATVPDVYPLFQLLAWATLLSALWLVARLCRQRDARTPVDIILLIWLVFPIFAFSVTWTPFYIHYLIPGLPAAFMLIGFAGHDFWSILTQSRRRLRNCVFVFLGAGLGLILALQVLLWGKLLNFVDERATPNGFGTPLHYLLDIRTAILSNHPEQVLIRVNDDGERDVWRSLFYDVPTVRFEDTATRVYPATTTVYLLNNCDEVNVIQVQFALRENEGCYGIGRRNHDGWDGSEFVAVANPVPAARFANGVEIIAYRWSESPTMCLSLAWDIEATTTETYLFAVHLFNAQNEQVAIADGLSWPGEYWRSGDLVVRDFCLSTANETILSAQIGMYTYDGINFYGVDLLDEQGMPVGQMLSLPLN